MFLIYRYTCSVDGKIYVGVTSRTLQERWGGHLYMVERGSHYKFHNAIRKHGLDAFAGEELERVETLDEALVTEKRWIAYFDSYVHGYNMTMGGEGTWGHHVSDEARELMAQRKRGRKLTEEHKRKIGVGVLGLKRGSMPPEQREKIAAAQCGKKRGPRSPEARARMSESKKRYYARLRGE